MKNNNPVEFMEELNKVLILYANENNEELGNYVAEKLNLPSTIFISQLPGIVSLIMQEIYIVKNFNKEHELKVDEIEDNIFTYLKFGIDYVISELCNSTELFENVKIGIESRNECLKKHWNNIAPKIEELKDLHQKTYSNSTHQIELYIKMIEETIEPMLRLDSSLLISAYTKKNGKNINKYKDNLKLLLNEIYNEVIPKEYKKILFLNHKLVSEFDNLRVYRNAFKHGNYKIEEGACIILEKNKYNEKLTIYDLEYIFRIVYNLRIYCKTVSAYIFDIYTKKYPELISAPNILIDTVTSDINIFLLNYGVQVQLEKDIFSEEINIDNKIFHASFGKKKFFLNLKMQFGDQINESEHIFIYIFAVAKAFENIFRMIT